MKFPNFNGVVSLLSFPSSAYLHPTPSARILFHELLKLWAACSEDRLPSRRDGLKRYCSACQWADPSRKWLKNRDLRSRCQTVSVGQKWKRRKGMRGHSRNCFKGDMCKTTSCEESTGSANASLVTESNFRVISEAVIENKTVSTWRKHNNKHSIFTHLASFDWSLNQWCPGQRQEALILCMSDMSKARRDGDNHMFEVMETHLLLDPVLIETCRSRISPPDLPVQLCSYEGKHLRAQLKSCMIYLDQQLLNSLHNNLLNWSLCSDCLSKGFQTWRHFRLWVIFITRLSDAGNDTQTIIKFWCFSFVVLDLKMHLVIPSFK